LIWRWKNPMTSTPSKPSSISDPQSHWTRVEIEWHAQDRYIPYDVLTRPGQYLAGAYPCLGFLSQEQSVIKTLAKSARITFDAAVENAKQQVGKLSILCCMWQTTIASKWSNGCFARAYPFPATARWLENSCDG
jgi:DNA relaxase NicK